MNELEQKVKEAKESKKKLEQLLFEYLPFLKKQVGSMMGLGLEYDDMLSIAMLVFSNCVMQYELERGSFLSFVKVSLKNRFIDESRKEIKNQKNVVLYYESQEDLMLQTENQIAIQSYDREMERKQLCGEIEELSKTLEKFDITFSQLEKISPKHNRAKRQCFAIAEMIVKEKTLLNKLMETKKMPQKELAAKFKISPKTIEKHRKYIVSLVILLTGDYPGIQAFLPKNREVKL